MSVEYPRVGELAPKPPEPRSEDEIIARWKGDPDAPLVSIVCHTYNHEHFIKDALDGFLMQKTTFPFEIIVNDDASTDGTRKIVNEYQEGYPRLIQTILHKENQYRLGVRPPCFTFPRARGAYIVLCEGDDYWLDEHKIAKQVEVLDGNPTAVMCYHDAVCVDENSQVVGQNMPLKDGYSASRLTAAPFIPTLTRMFRNRPIHWLDRRPLPVALDVVLTSYLSRHGGAVYVTDIAPAVYRVHDGGMWSRKGAAERLRTTLDAILFTAARYEEEGDTRSSRRLLFRAVSEVIASVGAMLTVKALSHRYSERLKKTLKWPFPRLRRDS